MRDKCNESLAKRSVDAVFLFFAIIVWLSGLLSGLLSGCLSGLLSVNGVSVSTILVLLF